MKIYAAKSMDFSLGEDKCSRASFASTAVDIWNFVAASANQHFIAAKSSVVPQDCQSRERNQMFVTTATEFADMRLMASFTGIIWKIAQILIKQLEYNTLFNQREMLDLVEI
ncbi:uncharacterized protein [Eurosta solidaginis]|uniref:uncharacterized protein n=1 Tax=Eurosta solidaginis TaxID=178769 RepID=UPI003530C98C